MNFLAHSLLAGSNPETLAAHLAADFVKGGRRPEMSDAFWRGIVHHRRIDGFTDTHPITRRSRDRFPAHLRRFAGPAVDVFFDHFLAASWAQHSPAVTLRDHADRVYRAALAHQHLVPAEFAPTLERMVDSDWLCSYADRAVIERVIVRMARRFSRPVPFAETWPVFVAEYDCFAADFADFFPQLCAECPPDDAPTPRLGPR